jgi:hypothetical protein
MSARLAPTAAEGARRAGGRAGMSAPLAPMGARRAGGRAGTSAPPAPMAAEGVRRAVALTAVAGLRGTRGPARR